MPGSLNSQETAINIQSGMCLSKESNLGYVTYQNRQRRRERLERGDNKINKMATGRIPRGSYWISRKDQLKVLQSAIRMDIVDRLVAVGPMSVKDLAAWTGKKVTPVYHHLRKMEKVGLIRSTREAGTRGRPGAVYEAASKRMRLARAPLTVSNRKPMAKIGRIMAGQAAKDYVFGFGAPNWKIEGPYRNHWVFRCVVRPSPKRLAKMNALFNQLSELIWLPDPSPGKLSLSVAWFLSPLRTLQLARSKNSHDIRSTDNRRRSKKK